MDILVKGMEMPGSCWECFARTDVNIGVGIADGCALSSSTAGSLRLEVVTMADMVNRPSHYTQGGIECIDAIRASMSKEAFAGYCKGCVEKYLWRYRHKGGVEDLEKAQVYLGWLIETERENEN